MTPCMASPTWTRSLAQNRQARLMRCLAAASPARRRPRAERVPRPTWRAAATRSARVLAWLRRRPAATVRTQPKTWGGGMAVPPRARVGVVWQHPCTRTSLRLEPPPFLGLLQTGDDSGPTDLVRERRGCYHSSTFVPNGFAVISSWDP